MYSPEFVAVDRNGNVYFSEPGIHIVRKVTPAGQIQTIVGSVGNYRNIVVVSAVMAALQHKRV